MKLLQWGNKKLGNMLMFNIPASQEICGRTCKGCYSHKAYKIYPNVLPAQTTRYEASLQLDFVQRICKELKSFRKPFKYLRIHGSAGEFYDQKYLNKWTSIAKRNPDIIFYAYTKRMKDFDFSDFRSLSNTVLIDSFHYGRINYGKPNTIPSNAFLCPHSKSTRCGIECTYCMSKSAEVKAPYFIQH